MFDFSISEITQAGNIYCSFFFFLIVGLYWNRAISKASFNKKKGQSLLFFLILLFAVTAMYTGDFFGYMRNVEKWYPGINTFHLEKVYEYIIEYTNQNYFLFRLVVWGGALVFYYLAAKKYRLNTMLALFVMFFLFTTIFCYARASLGMACYFCGFSLFCTGKDDNKKLNIILGIALMLVSYVFHKSMLFLILLTVSYSIRITKRNVMPILFLVFLLGFSIDFFMSSFLTSIQNMGDEQMEEKTDYLFANDLGDRSNEDRSLFGMICLIWEYMPFYLTFIEITKIILNKASAIKSDPMMALFRITFSIVILATSLLIFSTSSLTFFYRILYMSFIPLSMLTVYLYTNGFMSTSKYKLILYTGGGWNCFMFLSYFLRLL